MTDNIIEFPHPLSRFYLKPRGWMWEAWQYGWDVPGDHKPDHMLGCYFTKERAEQAVRKREEWEKERYGVWRFFVDD